MAWSVLEVSEDPETYTTLAVPPWRRCRRRGRQGAPGNIDARLQPHKGEVDLLDASVCLSYNLGTCCAPTSPNCLPVSLPPPVSPLVREYRRQQMSQGL